MKGTVRAVAMAKAKEAVALGVTSGLIDKDAAILDLAIVGKCDAEAIKGGFPFEIMGEELLLGVVEVNEVVNLSEGSQVRVEVGSDGLERD